MMEGNLGPEVAVTSRKIPMGLPGTQRRMADGYVLSSGIVLLESERDEKGHYHGGAGMDGMYLKTGRDFIPVRNEAGEIKAFREVLHGRVCTHDKMQSRSAARRDDPER